ncbi:uncharacterized protein LOC142169516 [Nicotiana tabacum]|uniref:Uncharacterized protein LOC142169516 n=1 Tax=Nicotiana tabacum TaxID=4097 RepID=A0AC58SR91_TOBAC
MDDLIDKTHFAFVPGRVIIDNIVLSHELVKGYGRKGVSPRCTAKLDMQKAYASLEWLLLKQILCALAFPEKFVKWIMTCVQSVTYIIILNGSPTQPFEARKRA